MAKCSNGKSSFYQSTRKTIGGFFLGKSFFLPLIPLVVSFVCYFVFLQKHPDATLSSGINVCPFLDSLFSALRIFGMSVDIPAKNYGDTDKWIQICLEVSRWIAVFCVAGAAYLLFRKSITRLRYWLLSKRKDTYSLHGDERLVHAVHSEWKKKNITTYYSKEGERFNAYNHVLVFKKTHDMLHYYLEHVKDFHITEDSRIYLYSTEPIHPSQVSDHVFINNMPESCARVYWSRHYLRENEKKIVILGDGIYAQQFMKIALFGNVFLKERGIEYHLYGHWDEYRALHPQLGAFLSVDQPSAESDSVFFHHEEWYRNMEQMKDADRIILIHDSDEENLNAFDKLLQFGNARPMHIRISSGEVIDKIWNLNDRQKENTVAFGMDQEIFDYESVTNIFILQYARLLNSVYNMGYCEHRKDKACLNPQKPSDCWNCTHDNWCSLSTFLRESNMAAADHIFVKIRLLDSEDVPGFTPAEGNYYQTLYQKFKYIKENRKDLYINYLEMEHRRWMRFYFYNGWTYADLPKKNVETMQHPMLLPFDRLPAEEVLKDDKMFTIIKDMDPHTVSLFLD